MEKDSRIFQAGIAELDAMMEWIRQTIVSYGFTYEECKKFEVALEEALVNIINHAYRHSPGLIEIQYDWNVSTKQLRFSIIDQGYPFNPLRHNLKVDIGTEMEKRKEGGLGIHLMKELTDYIDYQREDDSNVLTLCFQLKKT